VHQFALHIHTLAPALAATPDLTGVLLADAPPWLAPPGLGPLRFGAAVVAVRSLPEVIDAATDWIVGILAAVATLFFVIGALRYTTANGDPAAIEQAKGSLKAAGAGYALAMLAPVMLQILQNILGVRV
jgi:hypothetical protein